MMMQDRNINCSSFQLKEMFGAWKCDEDVRETGGMEQRRGTGIGS